MATRCNSEEFEFFFFCVCVCVFEKNWLRGNKMVHGGSNLRDRGWGELYLTQK
jgi:hypothetical protein